jgi:probable HAF family extracellular repeat protein
MRATHNDSRVRRSRTAGALLTALVGITVLTPARAQTPAATPSFQGLGQVPGATGAGTYVNGVSRDGNVVVGYGWISDNATRPYRWTPAAGFEDLGGLRSDHSSNDRAYDASGDGAVVVGQALASTDYRAFRWMAGGMQELPFYQALGVSADGSVAVGMDVRWTAPGQIDHLGFLGGNNYTSAYGVSADGQAVVGFSETSPNRYAHAFRWTPTSGIKDLGVTTGTESLAWSISGDGNVVIGEARDAGQFWRAFRWTSSLGMKDMGTLGGPMSTAHGASKDGSVIVGKSLINGGSTSLRAFRWTAATGMRDLRQELLNAGVTAVQNWILAVAAGVSDDGTVIVGWGYPAPLTPPQPYIAVLPVADGGGGGGTGAILSSLTLSKNSVRGGDSLIGTVRLSAPSANGTDVNLASSDTSAATVPSPVRIAAGSSSRSFTVSTKKVTSNRAVTISAAYAGISKSASLTVTAGR